MILKVKRLICVFFIFSLFIAPLFSATTDYEPYKENEFPVWLRKLHRAEVISIGATALTYPLVGLATNSFLDDSNTADFMKKLGISIGVGAIIALIDFIIGETSEK